MSALRVVSISRGRRGVQGGTEEERSEAETTLECWRVDRFECLTYQMYDLEADDLKAQKSTSGPPLWAKVFKRSFPDTTDDFLMK
ncbi:hypothetical protein ILYODFUR_033760 [Ilyodon furcidens]|uniref:Uncharacterized protein n=1 Tax=Ilyodon furcidens TaxID=33524 RepID=A0ABV0U122_9TELE